MSPTDTGLHHSASVTSGLKNMLTNLWRPLCAVVVVAAVRASCSATSRAERSRSRSTVCNHPAFWTLLHRPHATSCRCRASSSPTHNLHAFARIDELVVIGFLVSYRRLAFCDIDLVLRNDLELGLKIYVSYAYVLKLSVTFQWYKCCRLFWQFCSETVNLQRPL